MDHSPVDHQKSKKKEKKKNKQTGPFSSGPHKIPTSVWTIPKRTTPNLRIRVDHHRVDRGNSHIKLSHSPIGPRENPHWTGPPPSGPLRKIAHQLRPFPNGPENILPPTGYIPQRTRRKHSLNYYQQARQILYDTRGHENQWSSWMRGTIKKLDHCAVPLRSKRNQPLPSTLWRMKSATLFSLIGIFHFQNDNFAKRLFRSELLFFFSFFSWAA